MSGVNRNILQNGGIPLAGRGQTNLNLVTTSGSRFVLLDFPTTFLSSSNGGTCNGITLQWTPDSSLGFETSSAYNAVTQSTLTCEPSTLSPLTSSLGWYQFINAAYNDNAPVYYLRAYQNFVGGGQGPYSDIVSLQTNGNAICPGVPNSVYGGSGSFPTNRSQVTFDVNGWDPNASLWYSNQGSGSSAAFTATISGTPQLVKVGGPNYDAIKTNGGTISVNMKGSYAGQGGGTAQQFWAQMGLVSGSATMAIGGRSFKVTATDSTTTGDVTIDQYTGTPTFPNGLNTRNKLIGWTATSNGNFLLDGVATGSVGSSLTAANTSDPLTITTSADCVIRMFQITDTSAYPANVYHCKFG